MGRLSASDRLALLGQAYRLQGKLLLSLLRRAFGGVVIRGDVDELQAPDSEAARKAALLCTEVSPPFLVAHCQRMYIWARRLGERQTLRYDSELLYVACMLHDLGLTPAYAGCGEHAECFTVDSVQGAGGVARHAEWPPERQDALAEAILLHLNVDVPLRQGVEAHLLHEAAALDVLGLRAWEIAPETRKVCVDRFPRLDFKKEIAALFDRESGERPHGRIRFLRRYCGFTPLLRLEPFSE
ncbi:MAG: HD domain-containing protein [Candidatus Hydrogenedentes bacterium]|nr:HD domain-containing protein [Candidatus Hydrogenedentota bacterium]